MNTMPRPCNHTCATWLVCSQCFLTADGQAGPKPAAWWGHVVELRMADHGLRRVQGLEQLTGLRKACFAHNEISHIQGLEACTALQELSFEVCEKAPAVLLWQPYFMLQVV